MYKYEKVSNDLYRTLLDKIKSLYENNYKKYIGAEKCLLYLYTDR
jgi:hypothetical protein